MNPGFHIDQFVLHVFASGVKQLDKQDSRELPIGVRPLSQIGSAEHYCIANLDMESREAGHSAKVLIPAHLLPSVESIQPERQGMQVAHFVVRWTHFLT